MGLRETLEAATSEWPNELENARAAELLIALAPELAALALETDDLLRRLAEWDMLTLDAEGKGTATADAPWWRSEIQKARDRLDQLGQPS